jgi:hypothetical protein
MDMQDQLKQASNPATSAEDLMALAGHVIDVDRTLARHPNSTAELLESIMYAEDEDGNYDREVRTAIVRHPNVSAATFCELSTQYPKDAITNPSMDALLQANPELIDSCNLLLELDGCPDSWLKRGVSSSFYPVRLQTLRNPKLSEKLRARLSPEKLVNEAESNLQKFKEKQKDDLAAKFVEEYIREAERLPYAIPSFCDFDPKNPDHRLADQVICGFPYTSKSWPWPQDAAEKFMQPVAQIDLSNAGKILGKNFDDGLLQIWFSVHPDSKVKGSWDPIVRFIPRPSLIEPLDEKYPPDAPWNPSRESDPDEELLFGLPNEIVPSARVDWINAGVMFPRPTKVLGQWLEDRSLSFSSDIEKIEAKIEKLRVSGLGNCFDEKSRALRLGGYVFGYGNEADLISWRSNDDQLLLYVSVELFAMAVTFSNDQSGKYTFEARISCDR